MDKVKNYINRLTNIERKNSPEIFYYEGDFSLLEHGRRVSVVGSRKLSEKGREQAIFFVNSLLKFDITVVSGLAQGVDTVAHQTAINNKGKTIAVIGTPLDKFYPKENTELQKQIASEQLLISQFPKNYPVTPKNFPMRNRMMALISDATIIIEASEKSGTKHQGWEALRLGRELFINEEVINSNVSWAKEMLKYGASVINAENCEYLFENIHYLTTKEYYAL